MGNSRNRGDSLTRLLLRLNAAIDHRIPQRRRQQAVRRRRHPGQQQNQSDETTNKSHGMKIYLLPIESKLKKLTRACLGGLGIFATVSLSQADNF